VEIKVYNETPTGFASQWDWQLL